MQRFLEYWQKFRHFDLKVTEAVTPFCVFFLSIFLTGQAIYEIAFRDYYPEDFSAPSVVEGLIVSRSYTGGNRKQRTFHLNVDHREFVLPPNAGKSAGLAVKVGANAVIRTTSQATQGNWLFGSYYQQVMSLEIDGMLLYTIEDYISYKRPAQNEIAILLIIVGFGSWVLPYFLYIRPWSEEIKRKR